MVNADNVFFKTVAPSIGIAVATLLFLAPSKKVVHIMRTRELKDHNPLPYPLIAANCIAWSCGFAVVTVDPFVFFANVCGIALGLFYSFGCFAYATKQEQTVMLFEAMLSALFLASVGFAGVWADLDAAGLRRLWGWSANVILVAFYLSPLVALWSVIRRRDASGIHWPLALMTVINGCLWLFYGLALSDPFIWVPNGFGAIIGGINLFFYLVFMNRKSRSDRIAQNGPPVLPDTIHVAVEPDSTTLGSSHTDDSTPDSKFAAAANKHDVAANGSHEGLLNSQNGGQLDSQVSGISLGRLDSSAPLKAHVQR